MAEQSTVRIPPALKVFGFLLILVVVGAVSALVAVILEDVRIYRAGIERDRRILTEVLQKSPAYSSLEITEYSAGQSWLAGTVPTDEDYKQLERDVIEAFGREGLDRRLMAVKVERGQPHATAK
jgi:hypothetical protein